MFTIAVIINLVLFTINYVLPFNLIQLILANLIKGVLFIFRTPIEYLLVNEGINLVATSGKLGLYQSFYEFFTIFSFTAVLYLNDVKKLFSKVGLTWGIMFTYYTVLYSAAIFMFEIGINALFFVNFIRFNSEFLMYLVFLVMFYWINKKRLNNLILEQKP